MDKNEQREIALEEISKGIYEATQKGVGFDLVFLALHEMDKSAGWKLKYQFGFDDDTIKGIREAAEENAENDIKEYGSEEARKW
jgi:hypothetical protein